MKKRSRIIPVLCTLLVATFLFGTVSATNISMIGNTVTEPPLTQEELEHISECNALIEQQLARDNLTRAIYNNYLSMSVKWVLLWTSDCLYGCKDTGPGHLYPERDGFPAWDHDQRN